MNNALTDCPYRYGEIFGVRGDSTGWDIIDLRTGQLVTRKRNLGGAILLAQRLAYDEVAMRWREDPEGSLKALLEGVRTTLATRH